MINEHDHDRRPTALIAYCAYCEAQAKRGISQPSYEQLSQEEIAVWSKVAHEVTIAVSASIISLQDERDVTECRKDVRKAIEGS